MCLRIEGHANTATRLPRGYRVALYLGLQDLARAQPAFLTQNLPQPFGLISPSTSVQAFGSWKRENQCAVRGAPMLILGNCSECDNCYGVCADNAVIKLGAGQRFRFNYDYCKGCGVCAQECPSGAVAMMPEEL